MEKKYATYELSKLAKGVGFDEECDALFSFLIFHKLNNHTQTNTNLSNSFKNLISAPELTHLQQWVYEKFKVWVSVKNYDFNGNTLFYITDICELFDCPYKALEYGLLEFLKNQKQL